MLISAGTIRELAKNQWFVSDQLNNDNIDFIEGSAINLRLGRLCEFKADGNVPMILKSGTVGVEIEDVPFCNTEKEQWLLLPNVYYLAQTIDSVKVPPGCHGFLESRSRLFRYGIKLVSGGIHPGFEGQLTVGLVTYHPVIMEKGCEFMHMVLGDFDSIETDIYQGIWGGAKMINTEMERPK